MRALTGMALIRTALVEGRDHTLRVCVVKRSQKPGGVSTDRLEDAMGLDPGTDGKCDGASSG